jgi:ABC-type glycerol-3-phosphate transport system substrate-binding protein
MKIQLKIFIIVLLLMVQPVFLTVGGGKPEEMEVKEDYAVVEGGVDLQTPIQDLSTIDWKKYSGSRINIIGEQSPGNEAALKFIPEFKKLTGIDVTMTLLPEQALFDKMVLDLSSGSGMYDMVQMPACGVTVKWARAGWVESLNSYINNPQLTDRQWFDLDDFVPKWIDVMRYEGKLYGLPSYGESDILFYRKDLFEEHNVKVPTTMEELEEAARKLTLDTDKDGKTDIYGITLRGIRGHASNVYIWAGFLRAFGGKFFRGGDPVNGLPPDAPKGRDNWEPVINSPEAVRATNYYARLLNNYAPRDVASYHWDGVAEAMATGITAMIIDATCFAAIFSNPNESRVAGKVGYAPGPQIPSVWISAFAINSASKEKEATWLWLQWITSKQIQLRYALKEDGGSPDVSRMSVVDDPRYRERWSLPSPTGDFLEISWANINGSSPDYRPRIPEYWEIGDRIGIAIEEVITGGKTAKQALDEAQTDIDKIMRNAGYY